MVRGDLFAAEHRAEPGDGAGPQLVTLGGNHHLVRATVDGEAEVRCRYGTIVAAAGDLRYAPHGQGGDNLVKRALTGEGLALMAVRGTGDVWLSDGGYAHVITVEPGDYLSVASRYMLAMTAELSYRIRRVAGVGTLAGGLTNSIVTADDRPGQLAITAPVLPVVLPVLPGRPLSVDPGSVIGWSAQLVAHIGWARDFGVTIRGGDLAWLVLSAGDDGGEGFAIVAPAAGQPGNESGGQSGGGVLGNVLGNIAQGAIFH